jgi:hypothetical protein
MSKSKRMLIPAGDLKPGQKFAKGYAAAERRIVGHMLIDLQEARRVNDEPKMESLIESLQIIGVDREYLLGCDSEQQAHDIVRAWYFEGGG